MTDLKKIQELVTLQELFNRKREIRMLYAEQEQKFHKLEKDNESSQTTAEDIRINIKEMDKKINDEVTKREDYEKRINSLEEGKDKIKIARQLKSWEKEMERIKSELSLIQAQINYDTSKQLEMKNELERYENRINENVEKIEELKTEIETIKSDHADELAQLDKNEEEIKGRFELTFISYFHRMLSKTKGKAIVIVEEDGCSGCNIVLPTQLQGDLGPELTPDQISMKQCPHCFRYLYYREWVDLKA